MRKRYTKKDYTKKGYTKKHYTKKRYTKKRYTKKRQNNKVQYRLSKIKKQNYYLVGGGVLPSPLEYWNSVFTESEITKLSELRIKLQSSMTSERTSYSPTENSICELMMTLVPTYYIPKDIADQPVRKTNRDGTTTNWEAADFYRYYTTLCAAFLLFGIIAHKINSYADCNYKLILKGGKAIQVVLREIFDDKKASSLATTILGSLHQTQDIDVLLLHKEGKTYERKEIEELSSNISELIKWCLDTTGTSISILKPPKEPTKESRKSNLNIHKLSVFFPDGYVAFSDIDFGEVSKPEFYTELQQVEPYSAKSDTILLGLPVLFECPSIETLLDEKIYYYGKYGIMKDEAKIKGDNESIASCDYFLAKFKKAIISLNNGLQLSKTDSLDAVALEKACRKHLMRIVRKFKYDQELYKGIYSDPKEKQSSVQETSLIPQVTQISTPSDPSRPVNHSTTPECLMLAQTGTTEEWRLQQATLLSGHPQYAHGQSGHPQYAHGQSSQSQPASTIPIHTLLMQQLQQQQQRQPQQGKQYPQHWQQQQQWLQEQQRLQQQQLLTPHQEWLQQQQLRQQLLMHQQQQSQQQQLQQQQLQQQQLPQYRQQSQQPQSRQSQQQQPQSQKSQQQQSQQPQQYRVLNNEEKAVVAAMRARVGEEQPEVVGDVVEEKQTSRGQAEMEQSAAEQSAAKESKRPMHRGKGANIKRNPKKLEKYMQRHPELAAAWAAADEAAAAAAEQEEEQEAEQKTEQKVGHVRPAIDERLRPPSYWVRQERREAARRAAEEAQR